VERRALVITVLSMIRTRELSTINGLLTRLVEARVVEGVWRFGARMGGTTRGKVNCSNSRSPPGGPDAGLRYLAGAWERERSPRKCHIESLEIGKFGLKKKAGDGQGHHFVNDIKGEIVEWCVAGKRMEAL